MLNSLDDTLPDALSRAMDAGAGERDVSAALLARYYRHVPPGDLEQREPVDVLGAVASHRDFACQRPQGTANVRVFTPETGEHGWSAGHTVVEVVTDDMPFLVDSITAELTRQGRSIHLVVHPQLVVRRDLTGALREVLADVDAGDAPGDAQVESWIHVEVDRLAQEDQAGIEGELRRVLRDVREAVEDWTKMRDTARRVADELPATSTGVEQSEVAEGQELLRWLADDRFTFLGFREYLLETADGEDHLRAVPGSGLGILRHDQTLSPSFGRLTREVRDLARERNLLILTKANSRSTVHRPAYLDYIGVKTFDADGAVVGERRFLGLLTSAAYTESVQHIPVLRRKADEVLDQAGFAPSSHSGKDLLTVLETYPRDELFQISVDDLYAIAMSVLHLQERRRLRLFLRRDDYGRFMSCMVYLPRDRYTTQIRERMEQILRETFDAVSIDYSARVSESVLARLHLVARVAPGGSIPEVDPAQVEARLVEATRSWDDDLADALLAQCGEQDGASLLRDYGKAFPEAYKEDFPAAAAVADLRRLIALDPAGERHGGGELAMDLYEPPDAAPGERRFKLYRHGPVSLSVVLPVLREMGVEVLDERPYEIAGPGGRPSWVYDFGLRYEPSGEVPADNAKELFQDAFAAAWTGAAESDGFNALVLRGGLTWRQASVLRAYAKYLRQGGSTFSHDYLEQVLVGNAPIARLLVRLFEARFDPDSATDSDARRDDGDGLVDELCRALDDVVSLDHDRILRSFFSVICATLRTNYFQRAADGTPKSYVSFKLDPTTVPDLPAPRPRFEIWVYSPRVEGVHLRFGPVARGGLRWSDRREDFRTEVLGLVKAQTVKNAVIVPTGAKGGFVVKAPPDPADREAFLAEGIACYKLFICGLLDLTDNLAGGSSRAVVPPPRVVRHDGDDTYLVVAADKGTATFSDIANGVAGDYGYWLADAFASGGSAGYDHKAMGITARGAWESVKRHFREIGLDTQREAFTVVGIGDMSGDVFGNGMLLSRHIRLVAAFDHRHIFLDPNPDPNPDADLEASGSFAERQRLFDLPRSSWADYDTSLISEGGGVFPRTAKSIPVSAQVRERLGLADDVHQLTPPELMRAILTAPVDLFWNGGIGTYVKASTESNAEVGDKANDAIRVDGADLRCKVVGEGGNLGLTQLGRIEFARAGGHVNTDAIDNSAGVDCSDHEVNIKILLSQVIEDGDLREEDRNQLLADMTDEVAGLVLRDNIEQNVLLGHARQQAGAMISVHRRFIRSLVKAGRLDRALEFLPTDKEIDQRQAAGGGLTSSEFAVLVAYSKIGLKADILGSDLPTEPWFQRALRSYFPARLVESYDHQLDSHPLRREIVTTRVANDLVNRAGITFVFRAQEETGATPEEVTRAYTVTREVFEFERLWSDIAALDNVVSTRAQDELHLEGRRAIDRVVRWLLQSRRSPLDVGAEIARFKPDVAELRPKVPGMLRGAEREQMATLAGEFTELGVPEELAVRTASLLYAFPLLDVVGIARASGRAAADVAPLHYALSEHFGVDVLLTRITELPRSDRWSALARSALRYDLYAVLADLTANVLAETDDGLDPDARIAAWEKANAEGLARSRGTLDEIIAAESYDIATLSVGLRTIRALLRSGSAAH